MRVTSYVHLYRTKNPTTGVGKHIINMTRGLATCQNVNLSILASRQELDANARIPSDSRLAGLPVHHFPLPLRAMEQFWRRIHFPSADHFAPRTDWLYCPAEAYVPTSARLAVTIHDMSIFEPGLPWSETAGHRRFCKGQNLLFKRIEQNAAVILTVSEFSRQRISELRSIDPARIVVVGNGVEEEYFQPSAPAEAWQPGQSNPYILIVGGINVRKGGDHVIRLAEQLSAKKSPLKLKVAGRHDTALLKRALDLPNVTDLGFLSDEQLLKATRGAAISMLLSRYEGFGIPVLEAMAAGVPAVVSPNAALPEISGGAGVIVEPEDSAAIQALCHRLIEDTNYRAEVIARGRVNAEKYRWIDCVRRLREALTPQ